LCIGKTGRATSRTRQRFNPYQNSNLVVTDEREVVDITDHIAATLNEHDIDDYCDELDNGEMESGIYCIKCGWKGTTQREANAHLAQMIEADLGMSSERRTCEDGFGGVSSRCDAAGRIISTTRSGRSPTEMIRWVTEWAVFRKAVEHSHTTVHDEPITITSQQ
jgi:hypothetical protein